MFKILFISSEFPPGPGGIGTHAFNVSNTLRKRKFEVIICTVSDYVSDEQAKNFDDNCSLRIMRFKRSSNKIVNWCNRAKIIYDVLIKEKITHVFISGHSSIMFIPILKIISNVKIITIIHGSEFKIGILKKFSMLCIRLTDNIIAVSNFTKSLIPRNLQLKTIVAQNGIDLKEWMQPKNPPTLNNFPVLLTVGSISTRKGQHNIVSALPFIKKIFPNVHYHCVGQTKDKEKLLKLIKKLDVVGRVSIHGIVSKTTLKDMYDKAHVNMILSEKTKDGETEGYCISVLEGNTFGVPAIGSRHSGLRESIVCDINGILVNQKSPEEIASALKKILSNYKKFFNNSINHASSNTWDNSIIGYEKLIK